MGRIKVCWEVMLHRWISGPDMSENCDIFSCYAVLVSFHDASFIHPFIQSIAMCRKGRFLAILRTFIHSSLLHTFSCHSSPHTILPSPSLHLATYFLVYLSALFFFQTHVQYPIGNSKGIFFHSLYMPKPT
jgi:hypothetical protein